MSKRNFVVIAIVTLFSIQQPLFASVLDLSDYPTDTPLSEVNEPGFTFVVEPGATARVMGSGIRISQGISGVDLRILFDGIATVSHIDTDGSGSCQNRYDYVSWYLDGQLVEQYDTYDSDPSDFILEGRCVERQLTREFLHDEIRIDVADTQTLSLYNISNDVPDAATAVPVMPFWGLWLMTGLLAVSGVVVLRRRGNC